MQQARPIVEWMNERGISLEMLIASAPLEQKVIKAIVVGQYTPSPQQRRTLAAALGVDPESIAWGHTVEVQHIHGHGPQFGRSP
jgi:hypothetical protein